MRNSDGLGYQDVFLGDTEHALSPLACLRDSAKAFRAAFPGAVLIAGGAAFTIYARRVMEVVDDLDYGIVGEAEESLPMLLDCLHAPIGIPGLVSRADGEIVMPECPALADLSSLPIPDYRTMDVRPYISTGAQWSVGVQTKRGCSFSCAYCVYPLINGHHVRLRSPSAAVDEIELLVRDFGMRTFQFADSVFNVPRDHAAEICRLMIDRGIKTQWSAWFDIGHLDKALASLAVEAGCIMFELSPDSFSDKTLGSLRKTFRHRDIIRTCRMLRRIHGARTSLNFLFGVPGETFLTALKLLSFVLVTKLLHRDRTTVGELNPIRITPGTRVHQIALETGVSRMDTDFLPLDPTQIEGIYYRPDPSGHVEMLFHALLRMRAIGKRIRSWR